MLVYWAYSAFVRGDVCDITDPDLVGHCHSELPVEQVWRDRQVVTAVGGDLETPLSLGTNAVQLHELLHALFTHTDATGKQLLPGAWPAVTTSRRGMNGLEMHQQSVIAQMAALGWPDGQSVLGTPPCLRPTLGIALSSARCCGDAGKRCTSNRTLCEVHRRYSQNVALHLHTRQFGSQSTDFHQLGADLCLAISPFKLPLPLRLDLIKQRLVDNSQRAWRNCDALVTLHQPHCFLLEFERVSRPCCLRHFRSTCVNLSTQQGLRFSRARSQCVRVEDFWEAFCKRERIGNIYSTLQ